MMLPSARLSIAMAMLATIVPAAALAQPTGPARPSRERPAVGEAHELGVFRTVCRYSHSRADDPIVSPNRFNASHLHDFFGNVTTAADSTPGSLLAGDTTCVTGEDRSAYWVPALTRDGAPVKPSSLTVYYRGTRQDDDTIAAFPAGFRMIAGDAAASSPQEREVVAWGCRGVDGPGSMASSPLDCPEGSGLNLHVRFPSCWDGSNIDSADHKRHMAYTERGRCPESHPVPTPRLAMIVHYPITGEPGQIRLSSGSVSTAHADFFNAWDQGFLAGKVESCLNEEVFCGTLTTARRGRGAGRT